MEPVKRAREKCARQRPVCCKRADTPGDNEEEETEALILCGNLDGDIHLEAVSKLWWARKEGWDYLRGCKCGS